MASVREALYGPISDTRGNRRNFLKENVKNLRKIQKEQKLEKEKQEALSRLEKLKISERRKDVRCGGEKRRTTVSEETGAFQRSFQPSLPKAFRTQGVQTVDPSDLELLNEGVVRWPRSARREQSGVTCCTEVGLQTSRDLETSSSSSPHPARTMDDYRKPLRFRLPTELIKDGVIDFVKMNKMIKYRPDTGKGEERDPTRAPSTYRRGVVPWYLRNKAVKVTTQDEDEEDDFGAGGDRPKEEPLKKLGPKYVLLPESERLEHLRIVNSYYNNFISQLNSLSVKNDSYSARQRRAELEKLLVKTEEAIKLFSKENLYIKV